MNDSHRPVLHGTALLVLLLLSGANYTAAGAPAVSNVRAAQRPGTELVDVTYDLADPGGGTVSITVAVSTNGGTSYDLPASHLTGPVDVQNGWVRWNMGYRLPTEAEWEKAARGGLSGDRFPWGNTIDWSRANYSADPVDFPYDTNPISGCDPTFNDGVAPYTSPVGYFAANGYGLYDMAGNLREWCWDRYGGYSSGAQSDPRGPASGAFRVFRSGGWAADAWGCRSASRTIAPRRSVTTPWGSVPSCPQVSREQNGQSERSRRGGARGERSLPAERA
jgi:hypothetical protein